VVLVVHAAALLAVLDHQASIRQVRAGDDGVSPVASHDEVITRLLGHEGRYWEHTQARYRLNLSPVIRERAVAVGTLVGADDEASAADLLAAVADLHDQAACASTARWLHDLYPAADSGTARREWIGSLRPDLVAEHLITRTLVSQPGLADVVFGGLAGQRAIHALTILARAALTQPTATGLIDLALRSNPGGLLVPAMTVAVETNPAVGDQIAAALTASTPEHDLLARIAQALPDSSVALAHTATIAYRRLADTSGANTEQRTGNLLSLSNWLHQTGRREDPLTAINEAVTAYRKLANARPDAFLPGLASSLDNQSNDLAGLGRREDALAAINEAVAIRRKLAGTWRTVFGSVLGSSLTFKAQLLESLGNPSDAEVARAEAAQYL
jgi:hypothetical protein